jgi:hypothetical protein
MTSEHHVSAIMYLSMAVFGLIIFTFFSQKQAPSEDALAKQAQNADQIFCAQGQKKVLNCEPYVRGNRAVPCIWECLPNVIPSVAPVNQIDVDEGAESQGIEIEYEIPNL